MKAEDVFARRTLETAEVESLHEEAAFFVTPRKIKQLHENMNVFFVVG